MAEPTQLDRIEGLLRALKLQNSQQTALLVSLVNGGQIIMSQLSDQSAAIDNLTNQLAASFDAISVKLDAEGSAITDTATRVQQVIDQLKAGAPTQEVLDQLAGVVTKLGGTAAAIDASTTKIDTHVSTLQGIPATMPTTLPTT